MRKRKYRKKHNANFVIMAIFSVTFLFIGLAYANTNQILNITGTARIGDSSTPSLTLSHTTLNLLINKTQNIIAYTNATTEPVTWSSSNPEYVTVDGSGMVTAVSKGTAIITATCGNLTATCKVNVVYSEQDTPVVFEIIDDQTENNHIYYSRWFIRNNTTRKIISWSFEAIFPDGTVYHSSTFQALGINIDGNIFSGGELAVGQELEISGSMDAPDGYMLEEYLPVQIRNIQVEYEGGGEEPDNPDEPEIEVPATGLSIDKYYVELRPGETTTITATVQPENATGEFVWESVDTNVARVENGVVTAISPGQTKIRVTFGNQIVESTINVLQGAQVNPTITLNQNQLNLDVGNTANLIATVNPSDTPGTVNWVSSNTNVATVENGLVTALNPGQTTITASIGNISANCVVNVSSTEVTLNSITLNRTTLSLLVGNTSTLIATKNPQNAPGDIVWDSSDSNIVSVDQSGNIEAKSIGTAIITASVGNITAQCTVTVSEQSSDAPILANIIVTGDRNETDIWNGNITITNNSGRNITNWSFTLDLPDGSSCNIWYTPNGVNRTGLTFSGTNFAVGAEISLDGAFMLPSGYNWDDYLGTEIPITNVIVEYE